MSILHRILTGFAATTITVSLTVPAWATKCLKEIEKTEAAINRLIKSQEGYGVVGREFALQDLRKQTASGLGTSADVDSSLSQLQSQLSRARDFDASGDQIGCMIAVKGAQAVLDWGL